MTNLFQEGIFTKEGNHFFIDESVNYLIAERKKASPTKAKHFIIAKTKEKEYYISSLYPTDIEDVYNVDFRGTKYTLKLLPSIVEVTKREGKRDV